MQHDPWYRIIGIFKRKRRYVIGTLGLVSSFVWAESVQLTRSVTGPTPEVLAYNLGHFYPGSNVEDWWRFSGVNGARAFISPDEFERQIGPPPGDQTVTSRETFMAARGELIQNPQDEKYVQKAVLWEKLDHKLIGSNNRIIAGYAIREISKTSPNILIQMNMGTDVFETCGADDWTGNWKLWRCYFSYVYYFASKFGVERFAMHNEPNHTGTKIDPKLWRERAAVCADAAHCAMRAVNRDCGTLLRAKMYVPVTSGELLTKSTEPYRMYGQPIVSAWNADFLGERVSYPLYYGYAYQRYDLSPEILTAYFYELKSKVFKDLPDGMPPPVFALTEFNVHTGKYFDSIPETMDSSDKFTELALICGEMMEAGMEELYLFKFALTPSPKERVYPVAKNGMHYVDNQHRPYSYGGPTRGADVWRVFCEAFATGRERLQIKGVKAEGRGVYGAHDPKTGDLWILLVNQSKEEVSFELDLSTWDKAGCPAVINEVSVQKGGELVAVDCVDKFGTLSLVQPAGSVWQLRLPAGQRPLKWIEVPVTADATVKDGVNASVNYGCDHTIYVRNGFENRDNRSVGIFRFQLPNLPKESVRAAIVEFRAKATCPSAQAQVFLASADSWSESKVCWDSLDALRKDISAGVMITNRVVRQQSDAAQVVGQLNVDTAAYSTYGLDITRFLLDCDWENLSVLVAQEPRWDVNVAMPGAVGDRQSGGIEFVSKEQAELPAATLRLLVSECETF